MPCPVDALLDQPASWAHAHFFVEAAGEGAQAHVGVLGEVGQGQRLVEVLLRPLAGGGRSVCCGVGDRVLDVLRLAPVAPRGDDAYACHMVGDLAAVVLADEVQAGVDAGGCAG